MLAALAVMLGAPSAQATTYPSGFEERTVASGLTSPTAIGWAPDGRMFVAEKKGRVRVVTASGQLLTAPLLDISSHVYSIADRGLLGMAVDSDFATNRYLYLLYVYQPTPSPGSLPRTSRLTRVTVSDTNTASAETVLVGSVATPPCPTPSNTVDCIPADGDSHSIGTVRSAPDGTLWFGSGDASDWSRVDPLALRTYNEQSFAGKIMHVDRAGNGLPGHAFCPTDTDLTHVCTKLHAKGLRNPYRFTLRPGTGPLVGDVGWEDQEEVDLMTAGGRNYGWPCYEGPNHTNGYRDLSGCAAQYANEGNAGAATPPDYAYAHSLFSNYSAAVIGGPVYQGGSYPSSFNGDGFIADYVQGFIKRLDLDTTGGLVSVQPFATGWPAGVDLESGPGNELYFSDYGDGNTGTGSVKRIVYTPGNATPIARAAATPSSGNVPLDVGFSSAGSNDPDGDPLQFDWDFGDGSAHSALPNPAHRYSAPGNFDAVLTLTDGRGGSSTATVRIGAGNDVPTATIEAPGDGLIYTVGDTIQLRGSATDPQQGQLPGSALSWHVSLIHNTHFHDLADFVGTQPAFLARTDHDADAHYKITLTATDADGLSDQKVINIFPRSVSYSLDSSPSGAPMTYGGTTSAAPFTKSAAVGFSASISAGTSFSSGGTTYEFGGWSDGGSRAHNVTIPATNTTLTATYRPQVWFEGESMTILSTDATAVRVIAESNTSGGNTMGYRKSPSAASKQYTTTGYSDQMILRMRGDSCSGPPTALVTIDGFPSRSIDVPDTTYTDYVLPLAAETGGAPGTHSVEIDFPNNLVNSSCDRNLYLDKVTLRQADIQPPPGYPRPRGATPFLASLVVAYDGCTSPNETHGGGLPGSACKPPAQTSASLTVGTPDANGAEANMSGSVRFEVCSGAGCGSADVRTLVNIADVRCKAGVAPCGPANTAGGDDYGGEVQARWGLRVTDKANDGSDAATVNDSSFSVRVPCTATSGDATTGATCSVVTTANSVIPGVATFGNRAIWQLGQIQVDDGGTDGDVDTATGNTVFLRQGIFAP